MHVTETVRIAAPAERVWAVLADVVRWPGWNAVMLEVSGLDGDDLRVGARFRVRQPRLPVTVYTVDALADGRSFSWASGPRWARGRATHDVVPRGEDACEVTLGITQHGLAAPLGRVLAGLTRRYVATEAAGLRSRCEGA